MSNPVEEFLNHDQIEKTAADPITTAAREGWWAKQRPIARHALLVAGATGAGLLANETYAAVKDTVTRSLGFKRMMKLSPDLNKMKKDKVQAAFNTLHNTAPDLAKDPVIASSWVKRMAYQDEYVDPRTISDLASAQQRIGKPKADFTPMFASMADVERPRSRELFTPGK